MQEYILNVYNLKAFFRVLVSKNGEAHRMIAKRVFSEFIKKEIDDDGGKQIPLRTYRLRP